MEASARTQHCQQHPTTSPYTESVPAPVNYDGHFSIMPVLPVSNQTDTYELVEPEALSAKNGPAEKALGFRVSGL